MKNKYIFTAVLLLSILVASLGLTTLYVHTTDKETQGEFTVVTSFYPMYILAANIIKDAPGVTLTNLSEPQTGCLHDFQLTPEDMRLLAEADVFIINGGGIESFMEEVAEAYPDLKVIDASKNLELLQEEGEENAHAWMSISDYKIQVNTVAEALALADNKRGDLYRENGRAYGIQLDGLLEEQAALAEETAGRPVVLLHEAYGYVARDYGLRVSEVLNLDEERSVSAGEVAEVLAAIEKQNAACVLAERQYGHELGSALERESGVKVVYLDVLNRGDYRPDSYLTGMQHNIELLREAFQ